MSHKLIEFLVHFSICSYNVISCFYEEICAIYQIYILPKYKEEMKILEKIRSENRSRTQVRLRQRIKDATGSHTMLHEKLS